MSPLRLYTLRVQGSYTLATALWPLIHMHSFMWVTGYKHDQWLVKTVALLLAAIAVCLLLESRSKAAAALPVSVLGLLTAAGMAFVDFYYPLHGIIPPIYMADGVLEIAFIICWLLVLAKRQKA